MEESKMTKMESDFLRNNNIYQENFKVFENVYQLRKRSVEPSVEGRGGQGGGGRDQNNKTTEQIGMETNTLFSNLRGFLIFGRLLGVIPTSGVFSQTPAKGLRFKILSPAAIINMVISGFLGITAGFALYDSFHLRKSNALEIAGSVQGTLFRIWAFYNYVYFLLRADSFLNIFKTWGQASSSLTYSSEDKTLKRDIIIICTIIFSFAIFETLVLHMDYFPQFDHLNGRRHRSNGSRKFSKPMLEYYYERSHGDFSKNVRYDPVLAVIIFIVHKYVMGCWNYVDAVMIVFARALYVKFKGLCDVAEEKLNAQGEGLGLVGQERITVVGSAATDRSCWRKIVKDHDTLCSLLATFERFFSPLIFGSYAVNIYYICMQLIEGLSPDRVSNSLIRSIYAPASFVTLSIRVFLISNMAARINTYAHAIGNILKQCPIEAYDAEVARVDRHVTSGPDIGLTGIGMFTVTKPFLLSIINVVFTVEIVLLQGVPMPMGACTETKPPK